MKRLNLHWCSLAVSLALAIGLLTSCTTIHTTPNNESTTTPTTPTNNTEDNSFPNSQNNPTVRPAVNYFTVNPGTISPGQLLTLSWDVSEATSVTISPAVGNVNPSGSRQLSPASTTTYTLTATNEAGSYTKSVTVTVTVTSDDDNLTGCDPVSGRNQEIDFVWEQLCLATEYQVQIAKDTGFTMIVFDSGAYSADSSTSPTFLYPSGGASTPPAAMESAAWLKSRLEAGHTYYWRVRVRQSATGQPILSPWSQVSSFTVKSGLPSSTPNHGLQLLSPSSGCTACPIKPASFCWSPLKGTTKYKFILAKDAALTDIIVEAEVATTAYEYEGTLDYSTSYYWQVMAFEPSPSEPSATFSYTTEPAPLPIPASEPSPATPLWAWVIISIGAVFIITTITLIFKVHRI